MSQSFTKLVAQFQTVNLTTRLLLGKQKANVAGLMPINLRITIDNKQITRSTGIRIAPTEWDAPGQRIRGAAASVKKLNEQLQLARAHVSEIVNLMKATGRVVTARTLALQLEAPSLGKSPCFIALCERMLALHYGGGNAGTLAARQYGVSSLIEWRGRGADGKAVPLPLDEFGPEQAASLYNWLLVSRRVKASTANATISTLSTLFRRAAEMSIVELGNNPFRLLRKQKKPPVERLRLTLAQFAALRDADLSGVAALARDVYVAQYYLHGSRVGAVLKLRWADVSADKVRLQVEKGGPLKHIHISPELARVLARYRPAAPAPEALVFGFLPADFFELARHEQYRVRKMAINSIHGGLMVAAKRVGLPDGLHSHTARHTLALHAATTAGLHVTQKMLGHASIKQTEAYVGELPDEALEDAERLLYGVGAPAPAPPAPSEGGGKVRPMWGTDERAA